MKTKKQLSTPNVHSYIGVLSFHGAFFLILNLFLLSMLMLFYSKSFFAFSLPQTWFACRPLRLDHLSRMHSTVYCRFNIFSMFIFLLFIHLTKFILVTTQFFLCECSHSHAIHSSICKFLFIICFWVHTVNQLYTSQSIPSNRIVFILVFLNRDCDWNLIKSNNEMRKSAKTLFTNT